jgi:tetratricopeptide (TPR) repeat protein
MRYLLIAAACLALILFPSIADAGLYYSGETFAELPSQWRGFLLDYRALRNIAIQPAAANPASPARARYEDEAGRLSRLARQRPLTADEFADLGALYIRLGQVNRALEVLRPAQRAHSTHFRLAANLGTAWQLNGDLAQAAIALQQAVRLAPGKWQPAEELHLKLVRLRAREAPATQSLDNLFGVRYVGPGGQFEPGPT